MLDTPNVDDARVMKHLPRRTADREWCQPKKEMPVAGRKAGVAESYNLCVIRNEVT